MIEICAILLFLIVLILCPPIAIIFLIVAVLGILIKFTMDVTAELNSNYSIYEKCAKSTTLKIISLIVLIIVSFMFGLLDTVEQERLLAPPLFLSWICWVCWIWVSILYKLRQNVKENKKNKSDNAGDDSDFDWEC
jgi:uncharacterized membrane protein